MSSRIRRTIAMAVFRVGDRLANIRLAGAQEVCRRRFAECGTDLDFNPVSSFFDYPKIRLGSGVFIGAGANFSGQVSAGNDVMFGPNVHITDGYHRFDLPGKSIRDSGPGEKIEVKVEDDVWVGAGATLMRGVTVGEGSVVGARSVVLDDVPPYSVAVGIPARVVNLRFSDLELREHYLKLGLTAEDADRVVKRRRR